MAGCTVVTDSSMSVDSTHEAHLLQNVQVSLSVVLRSQNVAIRVPSESIYIFPLTLFSQCQPSASVRKSR